MTWHATSALAEFSLLWLLLSPLLRPSLFLPRYPPRMGRRPDAPPPRAGLRLSPNGQPRPVCAPPVLPAADHAGLPLRPRSGDTQSAPCSAWHYYALCSAELRPSKREWDGVDFFFHPSPPPPPLPFVQCSAALHLNSTAPASGLAPAQHCPVTRNPVQPGDRFIYLFIIFFFFQPAHWLHNRGQP